ncbi:MAG: hypothetical protein AABW65_02785 [Nanoarchaeota archaeon]
MRKKGQIQLSFGVIFSIIIVIATLAVAGYVLIKFVSIGKDATCKIFYSNLQSKIDNAWNEDVSSDVYTYELPKEIEKVCFGNHTAVITDNKDRDAYNKIKEKARAESNMAFYPLDKVCKDSTFTYQLKHVKINEFFCVPVLNGEASVKIIKESREALVKIAR